MRLSWLEKRFIAFTFSLVMGMALVLAISLLSSRPKVETLRHDDVVITREPAMVKEPEAVASVVPGAPVIVDLKCENGRFKLDPAPLDARQVRLKGRYCEENAKELQTSVLNRTNGSQATVFQLNAQEFTTDYVFLAKGTNHLLVSVGPQGENQLSNIVIERK